MKPVKIFTEWFDIGRFVGVAIKHGNGTIETIRIPADQLQDLADTLSRMAYHGYFKHHKAPQGSDYGRREQVEPKSESDSE